jgi:hypothetical protein
MAEEKTAHAETEQNKPYADTPGGQPQEDVEDRPNVSQVSPEDYPKEQRERY